MSHQQAFEITGALVMLGVIDFVSKGKAGLNSREAAEFRNLLSETQGVEENYDEMPFSLPCA